MENNHLMMQTMEPRKLFMKYLIPSLFGMVLMAINILIDGLFVSHGVGEKGLAGVNIAVPIYSVILSVSLWIGWAVPRCIRLHLAKAINIVRKKYLHIRLFLLF